MCPARSGCCVSTCRAGDGTWHEWPRPCGRGKEQPRSQGRSAALGTTHRTTRRGRLPDPESPARLCLSCALTCQTRSLRGLGAMLGAEGGPAECMRFCSCACCGDPALRALGALGSPPAERLGRPVCLAVTAAGDAPFPHSPQRRYQLPKHRRTGSGKAGARQASAQTAPGKLRSPGGACALPP